MNTPDVWVAKEDGSDIVRAAAIVGIAIGYNGNITAQLGGEGASVTLAGSTARIQRMTFTAS